MAKEVAAVIDRNDRNDRNERACRRRGNDGSLATLKKRLQKIDFALVEVVLYLDAYPTCRTALDYYHKLVAEREKLVAALADGAMPINAYANASCDSWDWIDGPWPWQYDAN